jgi:hypothetical protein
MIWIIICGVFLVMCFVAFIVLGINDEDYKKNNPYLRNHYKDL